MLSLLGVDSIVYLSLHKRNAIIFIVDKRKLPVTSIMDPSICAAEP